MVQNTLGSILDILEGVRNAFNFTVGVRMLLYSPMTQLSFSKPTIVLVSPSCQDPYKSSVLLILVVVVWLALALIPTRYIVLAIGLVRTRILSHLGLY